MSERFVTTSPDGSRDTLYERRSALSRDLLGDNESDSEVRSRRVRRRRGRVKGERSEPRRSQQLRMPELALGLVLVLGGAATASFFATKRTETVQVLAAAETISRGETITESALTAVEVEARLAGSMVPIAEAARALGQVVVADVRMGDPIMPGLLSKAPTLSEGEEVVALRVEVGDVPNSIAVGDRVRVVLVPDPTSTTESAPMEFNDPATVWDISRPSETSTDFVISLKVGSDFLPKAALAERSKIALVAMSEDVAP